MNVIDISDSNKELFCSCLEDWSDEIKEAGNHKALWVDRMQKKGLRVKLAVDDRGTVGGMIQYLPVEHSMVEGRNLYFINCIWVHGHKQGRGNFQKKGMGKALIRAAEEDARSLDAKGLVAWGLILPFFMKASWFKKQGYHAVDRMGMQMLLWKPFSSDAVPPRWIRVKKIPPSVPGKVTVTAFLNSWCTAQNMVFERAKKACSEFGNPVVFNPIDTSDRNRFLEWGISDAVFIDGKKIRTGPPPSYANIRKQIEKRVKRI